MPELLVRRAIAQLDGRTDLRIVAVILPEQPEHLANLSVWGLRKLSSALRLLIGKPRPGVTGLSRPVSLKRLSRLYGFEILVPRNGDINDPEFIALLKNSLRPTLAISLYCLQKFSRELLQVCNQTVNYHNGLLPRYRGFKATAWSLYNGDERTGFAFHRMNEKIDDGPVLFQDSIVVDPTKNTNEVEIQKAEAAMQFLSRVIDLALQGDPGRSQEGSVRNYTKKDLQQITGIEDPGLYSGDELQRRLRAFLAISVCLEGSCYRVTRIRPVKSGKGLLPLTFQTADGTTFQITRLEFLPPTLFRVLEKVRHGYSRLRRSVARTSAQ